MRLRRRLFKVLAGIFFGVIASLIAGVILLKADPKLRAYFFSPAHRLTYSLTIQRMREGKPYQDPFQSSGQEVFANGDTFRFRLISSGAGHVYLFNEGASAEGMVHFNILYPTPKRGNGSAKIGAGDQIESGENELGGTAETERLWIVWTKELLPELETAKDAAFANDGKIVDSVQADSLRNLLKKHQTDGQDQEKEVGNRETVITGNGKVIVSLLYLEHR